MVDHPLIDDVGSFPVANLEAFENFYMQAYRFLTKNDVASGLENRGFKNNFYDPVINSFLMKLETGLDVINYPQHYSMHDQFLKPIDQYGDPDDPFLIEKEKAIIPEVLAIKHYLNTCDLESLKIPEYSASRDKILLKACITGPIELYIKTELGFTIYKDVLKNFSKSVNHFAKSAIINNDRMETQVIAIDEPSLGFITLFNIEPDEIVECLDIATEGLDDTIIQIHMHSLRDAEVPLKCKNIDVLTCEYASDPTNVIERGLLEKWSKKMRVGVSRTNYNAIIGELYEKGIKIDVNAKLEEQVKLIDPVEKIKENYQRAISHYGKENVQFVGPDCGLKSWAPQSLAQHLLKRVVDSLRDI
ncbi:MAG: hypothetical protein ACFFCS_00425 [Candidatus Hodarchaeota archaeon]